jgi:hypothetical protein
LVGILIVWLTRGIWTLEIGKSLVCKEQTATSDALLLENFDPDWLVFKRAAALQRSGIADRVLVPVSGTDSQIPNPVSKAIAEIMVRMGRLEQTQFIPINLTEPISLNAANQIRDFLTSQNLKSILVVSPGFRSRRSALVYNAVLGPADIRVGCVPVFGESPTPEDWTKTWHGIEDVAEQFLKLQYYRFYVLR